MLEEQPSVADPTQPIDLWEARGAVDFDDVRFAYKADRIVLPDFDLHIPAGQTVALVGSTGAGKSTLAKLLARFYDPSAGSITLDGVDLRRLHPKDLRRAIVMVTQEAYLFSGSVAENIALGKPGASFEEIRDAARAVGADDFIMALPDGYDTDVNKRGGRVSAGQRQLLSFARAFLADPAVLILDEATASLDIPSERLVQEGLTTLLADRTAIIIAHRLSTVAIADRVLVMELGPHRRGRHARRAHRRNGPLLEAARGVAGFAWSDVENGQTAPTSMKRKEHHMPTITPSLWFDDDLEQAIEFYGSIFGDAKVSGEQRTARRIAARRELRAARSARHGPQRRTGPPAHRRVLVRRLRARARTRSTATGTPCSPAAAHRPHAAGSTTGSASPWQVIPEELMAALSDPDPEKAQYAMQAMLGQQKIVIAELHGARARTVATRRSTRKLAAIGRPDERRSLRAVVLEGAPLVVCDGVPGRAHHPPPRHVAAVVRHHGSDGARGARSDRGRDVAVGHRHALGDAGHDIQNRLGELGVRLLTGCGIAATGPARPASRRTASRRRP